MLSLLAMTLGAIALLIHYGLLPYAYRRLGIHPRWALWLLFVSLLGGYVNIPIAHLPEQTVIVDRAFDEFGMRFLVPSVVDWPGTIIAINVGGAIIPILLSLYLLARKRLWLSGLLATACVTAVCHAVAYPVQDAGIAMPMFVPPLATSVIAALISWRDAAALAYISGSLGTLIGPDLLNLQRIGNMGTPVASIGGAGTFDGIFLTGILAVLMACLLQEPRENRRAELRDHAP